MEVFFPILEQAGSLPLKQRDTCSINEVPRPTSNFEPWNDGKGVSLALWGAVVSVNLITWTLLLMPELTPFTAHFQSTRQSHTSFVWWPPCSLTHLPMSRSSLSLKDQLQLEPSYKRCVPHSSPFVYCFSVVCVCCACVCCVCVVHVCVVCVLCVVCMCVLCVYVCCMCVLYVCCVFYVHCVCMCVLCVCCVCVVCVLCCVCVVCIPTGPSLSIDCGSSQCDPIISSAAYPQFWPIRAAHWALFFTAVQLQDMEQSRLLCATQSVTSCVYSLMSHSNACFLSHSCVSIPRSQQVLVNPSQGEVGGL